VTVQPPVFRRIVVADTPSGTTTRTEALAPSLESATVAISDVWHSAGGEEFRDGPPREPWALVPELNGTIWRLVEFKAGAVPADIEAGLHSTPTVDLGLVLSGQVDLVLDGADPVRLSAGDHVVLRGSRHTWVNRGDESCLMSFLLVHAGRAS
jgi:hypothetical protein